MTEKEIIAVLEEALKEVTYEGHSQLCSVMKDYRPNYACTYEIAIEALAVLEKWRNENV
jgi:uncharacterized protein YqeY